MSIDAFHLQSKRWEFCKNVSNLLKDYNYWSLEVMEAIMKSYALDMFVCEKCGKLKLHELFHDEITGKDFRVCLKCDTKTEVIK